MNTAKANGCNIPDHDNQQFMRKMAYQAQNPDN